MIDKDIIADPSYDLFSWAITVAYLEIGSDTFFDYFPENELSNSYFKISFNLFKTKFYKALKSIIGISKNRASIVV